MKRIYWIWNEIKRRKVLSRNSVYAAVAFIILQIASIVAAPLNLPEWTMPFIIILLSIGLVISIVVSWIYDLNQEGDLVRTNPAKTDKEFEEVKSDSKGWKIASYVSFVLIIALIIINILPKKGSLKEAEEFEKSIAVLPFINLSADSTQFYFCEAMREEILSQLNKVNVFSVRSRTSTDQYRGTSKNSVTIGQELKVNYLVEGSVSLIGDQIKVWLQLINASKDEHIWSDEFIRTRKEIFELQTEIAKSLASQLKTSITPEEMEKIEATPTENTEAYHLYMRGKYYTNQPHDDIRHWNLALKSFKQAVALDSTFGLAWAELAKTYSVHYNLEYDKSDSCLENATYAAEKALKYGHDNPEVHLQIGYYYLFAFRDNHNRDIHWDLASQGMPNNVDMIRAKYYSMKTEGRWEDAIEMLEKGVEKYPDVSGLYSNMGLVAWFLRDYERANEAFNMAMTLSPDWSFPPLAACFNFFSWKGVTSECTDLIKLSNKNDGWYKYIEFWLATSAGNYEDAFQLVNDSTSEWIADNPVYAIPQSLYKAYLHRYFGENKLAEENFSIAMKIIEKKLIEQPNKSTYHTTLGICYAGLGMREDALKTIEISKEILPLGKDAMYGISPLFGEILIYQLLGETDMAFDKLEFLFSISVPYSIKYMDWHLILKPMKEHPRHTELKRKYAIGD